MRVDAKSKADGSLQSMHDLEFAGFYADIVCMAKF